MAAILSSMTLFSMSFPSSMNCSHCKRHTDIQISSVEQYYCGHTHVIRVLVLLTQFPSVLDNCLQMRQLISNLGTHTSLVVSVTMTILPEVFCLTVSGSPQQGYWLDNFEQHTDRHQHCWWHRFQTRDHWKVQKHLKGWQLHWHVTQTQVKKTCTHPAKMAPKLAMTYSFELNPSIPTPWKSSRPSWESTYKNHSSTPTEQNDSVQVSCAQTCRKIVDISCPVMS